MRGAAQHAHCDFLRWHEQQLALDEGSQLLLQLSSKSQFLIFLLICSHLQLRGKLQIKDELIWATIQFNVQFFIVIVNEQDYHLNVNAQFILAFQSLVLINDQKQELLQAFEEQFRPIVEVIPLFPEQPSHGDCGFRRILNDELSIS